MKAFFAAYENSRTAVRLFDDLSFFRIPYGHNFVLLEKLNDNNQRLWYAQKAIENGWSQSLLTMWIESDFYNRQDKALKKL